MVMDVLYLRSDDVLRAELEELGSRPFSYQASGRTIEVRGYWSAPAVDEAELRILATRALEVAHD
jgi:TfoX/Sxy family transcriptional regulator of competence genes